jgi:hypothetical protein
MSNGTLAKVSAKTAQDVCKNFTLGDDAQKLLREGMTPRAFLDALNDKKLPQDAIKFLAHALPKREAIWWALLCAKEVHGAKPAAPIAAALQATEKWITDPSEDNRRAAGATAEPAGYGTPAGCAAVSAFWSGGSLGPPNTPVVPPGEFLTAHGVGGSVMLAAVLTEPEKAPEKYRKFLTLGLEIASGSKALK